MILVRFFDNCLIYLLDLNQHKMKKISVFAICVALLTVTACKKSNYENTGSTNINIITNNSATMLELFHTAPTSFTVTAGVPKEIVGPKGTFLRFYPNSFKDGNGTIISGGLINIELTELYTAGDMLKHHTSTNTGSDLLTSGGEVHIKCTMNGQGVSANKYGIGFNASNTPTNGPREIFYGNTYANEGIVTWGVGGGPTGTTVTGAASVSNATIALTSGSYYMFDTATAFDWVASGHNYSGTDQNITVNVKFTGISFAGNVWSTAFMGLSTERVATTFYQESFDRNTHTAVYKGWAPMGIAQKFMVVLPYNTGQWYYYKTEQLITNGMTINATMTQVTQVDMGAAIAAF